MVSFASNDYLGLTTHPSVVAAAHEALDRWGAGSGASRLVTGSRPVHHDLEAALADWKGTEAAVVFPTGFAANLSVLSVFARPGVVVHSDELNHASIIDGCRLARADVRIVPHRDLDALDAVAGRRCRAARWWSRTPCSPWTGTSSTWRAWWRWPAATVPCWCSTRPTPSSVPTWATPHGVDVLRVGTLSKTLGSLGGFVAGPARFVELLVNRARPYIFTTAPTPADAAAALAAVGVVRSEEGDALRGAAARRWSAGWPTGSAGPDHPSPILPVVIGAEDDAVAASAALLDRGLWVPAIRPPTVAPGTSRLRITLSATHTDDQVDRLRRRARRPRCRDGGRGVGSAA